MGAEVSEVIVADRCNRHGSDWNYNGWGAVGGALVGGGFGAAAVSVWDKINDVKANVESVKATVKEAEAGIYKDISTFAEGTNSRVDGTAREVLQNRFTTERGLCDLGYKVSNDIRDSRDASAAEAQAILNRLCGIERSVSDCCCSTKAAIAEAKNELALQAERNFCQLKNGQEKILCLIKDQAKDQEIARLKQALDAQEQRELNQKLNFLIQREVGGTTSAASAASAAQQ